MPFDAEKFGNIFNAQLSDLAYIHVCFR